MKDVEAGEVFARGFNCAQAVLAVFADEAGLSDEQAFRLASAFGAGMARMQETCGAVTGGFMALGLRQGFSAAEDPEGRTRMLGKSRELVAGFRRQLGAITCRELLGCDLNTDEGQKRHREEGQREIICRKCVETAARLVEELG